MQDFEHFKRFRAGVGVFLAAYANDTAELIFSKRGLFWAKRGLFLQNNPGFGDCF